MGSVNRRKKQLLLIFTAFALFAVWSYVYQTPVKAQKTPVDTLFIGDSITYGWTMYPQSLFAHFGESVAVHGIGGLDTLDLYTILSSTKSYRSRMSVPWWYSLGAVNRTLHGYMHLNLQNYKPSVVVLEIGVNNWLRTQMGADEEQIKEYRITRNYKKLGVEEMQEDAAVGSVNNRGVYQIIYLIKELYGDDTPIILVGAFPTYQMPDPAVFNYFLKGFLKERDDPILANVFYVDSGPIARIGWSEEYKMFYDHDAFPQDRQKFDSIHVDWGHLNEKGYDVFAKMLECPVKKALDIQKNGQKGVDSSNRYCPAIRAADLNAELSE